MFVVIVGQMVIFVVRVCFQMKRKKNLMRKMTMNFESFFVSLTVFLLRVLLVIVERVEQLVHLMTVMIVQMFSGGGSSVCMRDAFRSSLGDGITPRST